MSGPADRTLLVAASDVAGDGRPVLAHLVGADYSALAITPQRSDCAPGVVRAALPRFAPWDSRSGTDLAAWCVADHGDAGARGAGSWDESYECIHSHALRAHDAGTFVVGLGGDHSVTWPLFAAARQAFAERHAAADSTGGGAAPTSGPPRVGLVQFDVHHDVRSLEHGPSNGTPVRGLVDSGLVLPGDVVQVGIHPFANRRSLTEYCEQAGIHRISLEHVASRGPVAAVADALEPLADVDAIYVTVDIDVLDRAFAPGTAAALPGGLSPAELVAMVESVCADSRVIALDVVEFDPERDVASITAYAAAHVVVASLAAVVRRPGTSA